MQIHVDLNILISVSSKETLALLGVAEIASEELQYFINKFLNNKNKQNYERKFNFQTESAVQGRKL